MLDNILPALYMHKRQAQPLRNLSKWKQVESVGGKFQHRKSNLELVLTFMLDRYLWQSQ